MTCELEALEFVANRILFLDKDSSTFTESTPTHAFLNEPVSRQVSPVVSHAAADLALLLVHSLLLLVCWLDFHP